MALISFLAAAAFGQTCPQWKEAVQIGDLQPDLKEASGIAASKKFPGRLYHINDSGDTGRFFITDMNGRNMRFVAVAGLNPIDTEALSLGPCGGSSCLFIGDIGDNNATRRSIEVISVPELEQFEKTVQPRQRLRLRYPDKPHDAESLAVHPDGTIYILTKESPAHLFKADPKRGDQTLTPVMMLDAGGKPTDMTISDDGTRLLVLTYLDAVEFGMDLAHVTQPRYRQKIAVRFLQQQESLAYLPGSRSFVYTSEQLLPGIPQWIMRVDCAGN